jgi:hypothetical protein
MDPKPSGGMLLAPPFGGGGQSVRLPSREAFPPLDEHLVEPEASRDEVIRGRRVIAQPALAPHADQQLGLAYVLRAHVKPGYVGSIELLTRLTAGSDFATDACVRKTGKDPATSTRYLEELAFEVVNEQSLRDVTDKAEDMTSRGVRRVIAIFVKTGKVCAWSPEKRDWQTLDAASAIEDECLSRPIGVRALLDAAEADNAVAEALIDKQNPVIEAVKAEGMKAGKAQGVAEGKATAIVAVLKARGVAVSDEVRARILGCGDDATLDRWIALAAVAGSAGEVVAIAD